MDAFYIDLGISIVLSVIKQSVKNPKSKANLKAALLKVRNAINALYAGDEDFE